MVVVQMGKMLAEGVRSLVSLARDGFRSLVPVLALAVYTLLGAVLFMTLEAPNELHTLETLKKEREDLIENTAYRLNNIRAMRPITAYNHTVKTLTRFQEKLGVAQVVAENQQWTFSGALFYSMTVYTTIGYGNIVPVTTAGRVLTIIYAFVGIPIGIICLFGLGSLFAKVCRALWGMIIKSTSVVSKDLEKKMNELGPEGKPAKDDADDDDLLSFPLWFLIFFAIVWILSCAAIFLIWEDEWDYGTSLYFTLISFLTIGFGDVLPSNYNYMVVVGILLLIGLALVSTVLQLIQQQIEALTSGVKDNIDKEYMNALAEAEDEGEIQPDQAAMEKDVEGSQPPPDPRSLEVVLSKMPLKSRMLYHCMSASNKKQLQEHSAMKMKYKNRSSQTDDAILREYALEKFKDDFKAINYVVVKDFSGQEKPSTTVFHGDVTAPSPQHVTYSHPRKIDIHLHPHKKEESPRQQSQPSEPETVIEVPIEHVGPSTTTVQMGPQRAELIYAKTSESEEEEESEEYTPHRTTTLVLPGKPRDTDV